MYFSNIFDDFHPSCSEGEGNFLTTDIAIQTPTLQESHSANSNTENSVSKHPMQSASLPEWSNIQRMKVEKRSVNAPTSVINPNQSDRLVTLSAQGKVSPANSNAKTREAQMQEKNTRIAMQSKGVGSHVDEDPDSKLSLVQEEANKITGLAMSSMQDDDDDDDDRDDDDDDDENDGDGDGDGDDDGDGDEAYAVSPTNTNAARKRKQELHRRHSKRYRDNIGELFQSLESLLPKVIPGCKLKTKSQIISNSVEAVVRLRTEVASLEMQYVLSSPTNRTKWVQDTVTNALCFQEVVEPFMRLLLGMQRWKHSELWGRFEANIREDGTDSLSPVENATNTLDDLGPISSRKFFLKLVKTASAHDMVATETPDSYKSFSRLSQLQTFIAGDDSLVGRIATSLSPEWIDLADPESRAGFKRAETARECGFSVCFAVPFLVRGHVFATVLFFDDQQRSDIGPDINIAQDLASSLGNCYGASTTLKDSPPMAVKSEL